MRNKLIIAAALMAGSFGFHACANPINGTIEFIGGANLNGTLANATQITGYSGLTVLAGAETDTYAPLNGGGNFGGTLSFSPFGFTGDVLNPNPVALWTVTFGGNTYSFSATSVVISEQSAHVLSLSGTGTAYFNGGDPTVGTWSITDSGSKPLFTFGASTTVPDGGMTVALLGIALGTCGVFFRRMKKLA